MTAVPDTQELIRLAIAASEKAYVPYSHYPVGAALLAANGTIYTGCNVENAAYPATICAERTALVKAVSEGQCHFEALAVVTRSGGSPCGVCRQMLYEFAPNLQVIIADLEGNIHTTCSLADLLPHGFGPQHLE
ncbi:MAG: cytidine deaminase [Chloroflexi bacterium]|nr:cytidine deaminase [Chloroflexota bacterium]